MVVGCLLDVIGLVWAGFVPRWAGRASLLVIPVWRFSHTSALICLHSWRCACLWQTLDFWDTHWAPLFYFLFAKCCIPVSLLCTWALQHCHAALMAGHSAHQEVLPRVTQSYCGLWCLWISWAVFRLVLPTRRAKKQMQRMQGLSQPLPTSEQLWVTISVNFSLVNLRLRDIPVTLDMFTQFCFCTTKEAACSPAEYCIQAVLDLKMFSGTLQYYFWLTFYVAFLSAADDTKTLKKAESFVPNSELQEEVDSAEASPSVVLENIERCSPSTLQLLLENISGLNADADFTVELIPEINVAVVTFIKSIGKTGWQHY